MNYTERHKVIRDFYDTHQKRLLAQSDEWAIDPYAWDDRSIGIQLTPIEWALWDDIRMCNAVMYPQYPVGPFFVDFGNPAAKVAIECDGERWHTDKAKDAHRQRAIEAMGWSVYRITGRDCFTDTEEIEDDDGRVRTQLGRARLFVKAICVVHPVQRLRRGAPQHAASVVEDALELLGKAACLSFS